MMHMASDSLNWQCRYKDITHQGQEFLQIAIYITTKSRQSRSHLYLCCMLTTDEYIRYSRHIAIPSFGKEGQLCLKQAKVLVVGAGGLGAPLLLYLAAAGIGKIGIVEADTVDISNLQRQVLFDVNDISQSKVQIAKSKLAALNPEINIEVHESYITTDNAEEIISQYDIVADGTDNFPTRYLVNDACVLLDKVNVYGSVYRFEGQVSVFNLPDGEGGRGPNYRDLFPEPPPADSVPNCAEGGVLGVLPGIIGSMQALEVIKIASGVGEPLSGKLFLFDALSFTHRVVKYSKNKETSITELINYDQFCGITSIQDMSEIKEITVTELKEWKDSGKDFQLIDCREQYEFDFCNLEGELIPLGDILQQSEKINKDKDVVIHCRSGQRSATAIMQLQQNMGFTKLHNLKGGILAWSAEVDPSVPTY